MRRKKKSKDVVAVAPEIYNVVLENERVRVLEVRGKTGEKTEMHSHPAVVAITITGSKYRFALPDGQTIEAGLKTGEAIFLEPVEHSTEILGTAESRFLLVELK